MLTFSSVRELSSALVDKKISSVELTRDYLQKITATQSTLNAFIDIQAERSLAQARMADERRATETKVSPLLGIPIAHKDIFVTTGWRTTAGSKILADYVSPFDAHVVEVLYQAGMVCLGKTNCDEFAMGSANEHSYFGAVHNPWDRSRIPGGSSGGSACAVAADLAPVSTGTDTGGSIRQPASLCGITGIKPTYGRVSRYGMIAFASSLDQGGIFGRSAEDCAYVLGAMMGHDSRDSTSLLVKADDGLVNPNASIKGLRIGIPRACFGAGVQAEVNVAIEQAIADLVKQGAICVDIELPHTDLAVAAYYIVAAAEASSNLSRFDGVRYGHRAQIYESLNDLYRNSRSEGFGAEVQRRILLGTYVLSHGYYDAYYVQAQKVRRLIAQSYRAAFVQCDVIVSPVCPTSAWKIGAHDADPTSDYLADIFTLPVNLAGLPALSVPCGFDQANLPIGMQLIGNYLSEAQLLAVGQAYQKASDWHLRRPKM